jgi:hypothetical protein
MVIIIAENTNKTALSTVSAGKATLWHFIVIVLQPPIRKFGIARATMLEKNIPISKPKCVLWSMKTIMQAPKAAINNPIPTSACADQWQIEKLIVVVSQQLLVAGSAQQSSALSVDVILGSQTLNRNCGPNVMSNPIIITIEPQIIAFFIFILEIYSCLF